MAKVLGAVFLLLVGFLVALGGYSGADAQDTDTPTPSPTPLWVDAPFCNYESGVDDDCWCSLSLYNESFPQPEDCFCQVGSWCEDKWSVRIVTPEQGSGVPPVNTPAWVTATPAANTELFPTDENGCPDWSYLGEGTVTPAFNDVSMDYAMECGHCLASGASSIGGGVIAVPVINTPAGSGGGPVMLLSDVDESLFSPYSYVSFYMAPDWGIDWLSWPQLGSYFTLAGAAFDDLEVVGLLFDVEVIQGSGHARALGSWSGLVRDSFWMDDGVSYCVGIHAACDAVGAGLREKYAGNVVTVETALEGFQAEGVGSMVEGRLNNIDFIVREGSAPLQIIGGDATPTPTNTPDWVIPDYWENSCEYDFSVWSPNQTVTHYFPCVGAVQQNIIAAVLDGIGKAGGNGNAVWSEAGNYSLASYTSAEYRTYAKCFYVGNPGSVGDLYCQSQYPSYTRQAINEGAFVDGALRVVVTGNNVTVWGQGTIKQVFDSGVVNWPTPTPSGPSTATPTPVWGTIEDCSVVEWRSGADGSDVLTWDWGGWLSEPECYTFIPQIDETIPLSSIPFLGLDDVSLEFPGFEICLQFVDFPSFSVLGLAVHLDWFLVGLLVFLAGWLIRM